MFDASGNTSQVASPLRVVLGQYHKIVVISLLDTSTWTLVCGWYGEDTYDVSPHTWWEELSVQS